LSRWHRLLKASNLPQAAVLVVVRARAEAEATALRVVTVKAVRMNFPDAGVWRCRIEVSPNGERDWRVLVDSAQIETPNMWTQQTVEGPPVSGRYLRVTLLGWPQGVAPGIGELMASGTTVTD